MSLGEFQRALVEMTVVPRFAASVRSHGSPALEGFALSTREAARLVFVSRQAGMDLSCTLARANRFGPIYDVFPMTCLLLAGQLRQILDDLWSRHRPDTYQLTGEERAFAEFISKEVVPRRNVEYLSDIFEYEKACLELIMEISHSPQNEAGIHQRAITFGHDPRDVLLPLQRGDVPSAGIAEREYVVTVRIEDGEVHTQWHAAKTDATSPTVLGRS